MSAFVMLDLAALC